jgi:hypothetical protein
LDLLAKCLRFFGTLVLLLMADWCTVDVLHAAGAPLTDTLEVSKKMRALDRLSAFDTCSASPLFPNIKPGSFYLNLQLNILNPERVFQGNETSFCGYAALTTLLCKTNPDRYVEMMLQLYQHGDMSLPAKPLHPSEQMRYTSGSLTGKGNLNERPADQLWFFALADHYKCYLNSTKSHYKKGYENTSWAAVSFAKFHQMAEELGGYTVHSYGSDLIKPRSKNNCGFLQNEMKKGTVVLFVNNRLMHPNKFRLYSLRMPTHFIVLEDIQVNNGVYSVKYWDYGFRTIQYFTKKQFKKLIFGIIRLNEK